MSQPRLGSPSECLKIASGAVAMISPSVRACAICYKNTRAKSQRLYPERQSASPWPFCGLWSIKASRLARANDRSSGKPCVP